MSSHAPSDRQLRERLQASDERLRQSLVTAQRQRERWADELHDNTLQCLAATSLQLQSARDQPSEPKLLKAIGIAVDSLQREIDVVRTLIRKARSQR